MVPPAILLLRNGVRRLHQQLYWYWYWECGEDGWAFGPGGKSEVDERWEAEVNCEGEARGENLSLL